MTQVRVNLDSETFIRLIDAACSERRPVPMQAEVMLRRALGLPFPYAHPAQPPGQGVASPGHEQPEPAMVLAEAVVQ